jgi:fructose-specific phosphotransferase system IIB component
MKIALITACVAGVAHSRMAATAIKKEAEARGFEIIIEEQGGYKMSVKLTKEQIEASDLIIVAKAVAISGKERLIGKKILDVNVNKALRDPKGIMDEAVALFLTN